MCSADAAVAVHPGLVQTHLAAGWLSGKDLFLGVLQTISAAVLTFLSPAILEPAPRAARTVLFAALAPPREVSNLSHRLETSTCYLSVSKNGKCLMMCKFKAQ